MERIIRYLNKCLIIALLILISSCSDDYALIEETLYISDENRDWLAPDIPGPGFIMVDNNHIAQGFNRYQNSSDFSPSTSSYFGIRTRITKTESYTQGYSSNYGQRILFILTAGFEPFGDRFSISINELNFMYDFKFKTIGHLYFNSSNKSQVMTDTGYVENEKIYSTVEMVNTLTVNGVKYDGILHFCFEDFKELWTDFTVKEVYLARKYGLIKYSLNNGITYER